MRFLADMCIDVRVVQWLISQGHDCSEALTKGAIVIVEDARYRLREFP